MKHYVATFLIVCVLALAYMTDSSHQAQAQTVMLAPMTAANLSRACSYKGAVAVKVTTSATSAATGSAFSSGLVRVVCTTDSHFRQAGTSPTALATDSFIKAGVVETMYSEGDYFAFIQDTGAGACYVTACR